MPLRTTLRPLRHRDFALLFSAGLVSSIGSWVQTVAVGALVVHATGRATWAALVAAATFLPMGALSPVGGALADRIERRRFLIAGYVALTGLATLLAALSATGRSTPGTVLAVVFASGCVTALVFPFQQAILPELVPRDDLLAAVSLGSAEYNIGRVVGPALAGVVIAVGSFTWAFALNAASFLAVVVALSLMRFGGRPGRAGEGLLASIRDGARAARAVPGCRAAIALIALAALLVSPFIALVPAMADLFTSGDAEELGRATGALVTSQGVGAVAGALALAPLAARLGRERALLVPLVGTPLALVAYASAPSLGLAAVAIFAVGAMYIGILNGLATVVQLQVPDRFRGRVISLFFVALGVVYPVGSLLHGAMADWIGLRETTTAGAAALLGALAVLAARRPHLLRALGDAGTPVASSGVERDARGPATAI